MFIVENELNVFKRACFSSEAEKKALTEEVAALREKVEILESDKNVRATDLAPKTSCDSKLAEQTCEKRLACVIDGNGTLFSTELMARGLEGGQLAAKQLSESIQFHLTPEYPFPLWVYVFYDKNCLAKVLSKTGKPTKSSRTKLEEFVVGFNQACERFVMVDVASDEDAVASKVEGNIRS